MTTHLPRAKRRAVGGLVLALSLAAPLAAAPLTRLSLEELTTRSDACLLATVVAAEVHWNEARTLIVTSYELDVEEDLAGRIGPGRVLLHRVGGELDGLALAYTGMAELDLGDRAVVFVKRRGPEDFIVSGLRQGVLHERDGLFVRDLRDVVGAPAAEAGLRLEALRERVRLAAANRP